MRNPQKCGFFYFIYRYLLLNNIKTMYKNFNLTDQERKEILEQHQSKGYKQPLKESTLKNDVDEISLTPDDIDENLGMLARIAAPMAASYVGSKMADTNEEDDMTQEKTPSNLVACSALGVKFAGLCDKVTKKPVVECAKLGVKTVGYCFVDTKQPVNVLTPKGQPQPLSELGGYIGDAPEKIDGPFMKEIDPSVYEDISYLDAMKADILLMRLFRNDIISKDAFLEVRKPIDEVIKILKGGYFEKEKDVPF